MGEEKKKAGWPRLEVEANQEGRRWPPAVNPPGPVEWSRL